MTITASLTSQYKMELENIFPAEHENNNTPQIFQTNKPTRWKRFKWTGRVLLMITIFFLVVLGIALYSGSLPNVPNLQAKAREYETALDPTNPLILKNNQNTKYKGFKDFLFKKLKTDSLKKDKKNRRFKSQFTFIDKSGILYSLECKTCIA